MSRFLLLKPQLLSPNPAHFAGGKWAVLSASAALSLRGLDVHIVTSASKAQLLAIAVSGGYGCSLQSITAQSSLLGGAAAAAQWQERKGQSGSQHHVINYNVVLTDDCNQAQVLQALSELADRVRLGAPAPHLVPQPFHHAPTSPLRAARTWMIIDADDCQGSTCGHGPPSAEQATSLFESVVHKWQRQCLAFVQNVHFLPFGRSGTTKRTPGLLQAWSQLGGILCVSEAVAAYLREAWAPSGPSMPPLRVVHLSAFGCFGTGPFQDFGTLALKQLKQAGVRPHQLQSHSAACGLPLCQGETSDKSHAVPDTALGSVALPPTKSKFAAPLPVLGVLKLTPEKGCSVVLALAQVLLGRFDFLVVAGDPKVKQIFGEQPNVQVIEPHGNIEAILSRVCLVLAPSLWFESWGMVVTEALLRGVPCIVSNAGGLPEAGMGVCPVCPVTAIEIPEDDKGTPCWAARRYPQQSLQAWLEALDWAAHPTHFEDLSRRCRHAAHRFLKHGATHELPEMLDWLESAISRCAQLTS